MKAEQYKGLKMREMGYNLTLIHALQMQELSKSVSKADQDIHECSSQIDDLRLQLLEMNGT